MTENTTEEVCQTEACRQQTADLVEQMDRTVDPCQDFYQFACGGFINKTVVPKDLPSAGVSLKLFENKKNRTN